MVTIPRDVMSEVELLSLTEYHEAIRHHPYVG